MVSDKMMNKEKTGSWVFLKQPRTLEEITDTWLIYGKPGKAFHEDDFRLLEVLSIQKHLKRLIERGRVLLENNCYRVTK